MTPAIHPERYAAIVLCGGQSRRMGRSKALLPFGDELMLQRIVRILHEFLDPVVVVAAPDQQIPSLSTDIQVVRDAIPGQGPLEGFATGLRAIEASCDVAYVTSCDAPFLQRAFVYRMIELLGNHAVAVPDVDGRRHPLAGVYRIGVLATVNALLAAGHRRLTDLLDGVSTRLVCTAELVDVDPELRCLRNVNTPEEYEAALRDLET